MFIAPFLLRIVTDVDYVTCYLLAVTCYFMSLLVVYGFLITGYLDFQVIHSTVKLTYLLTDLPDQKTSFARTKNRSRSLLSTQIKNDQNVVQNFHIPERSPQSLRRCQLFATRKDTFNLHTLLKIDVPQPHIQVESECRVTNTSCVILTSSRLFVRSRCWQQISSLDWKIEESS